MKKLTKTDFDNFNNKLSTVKTKKDLREAFSYVSNDPDAAIYVLNGTYAAMASLHYDLIEQGIDKDSSAKYIVLTLKDYIAEKNVNRGAKVDCMGGCSAGLNIGLDQVNLSYNVGMAGCVSAALLGYGALIFTGPGVAGSIFVAAGELSCIGLTYYNYVASFNLAIQSFDNCTLACA